MKIAVNLFLAWESVVVLYWKFT